MISRYLGFLANVTPESSTTLRLAAPHACEGQYRIAIRPVNQHRTPRRGGNLTQVGRQDNRLRCKQDHGCPIGLARAGRSSDSSAGPPPSYRLSLGSNPIHLRNEPDEESWTASIPLSQLNVDALGVQVGIHVSCASLRAVATTLRSAESDQRINVAVTVHPHGPGVDAMDRPKSGRDIL